VLVVAAIGSIAGLYAYAGSYGIGVLLRRGGSYWVTIKHDDERISPSMRIALRSPRVPAQPGTLTWRTIDQGFEVADLPVLANGREVDRIALARIDPQHFRFVVRNEPAAKDADDWLRDLNAVLVINGSYYDRYGLPDTPVVSDGKAAGPRQYDARHGAFVAGNGGAAIRDLKQTKWQDVLQGSANAMVSYPLLLATDGSHRVRADWRWLANRSFVGQDATGRIVLGTTKDAYFSLERLAEFLSQAPLQLTMALNLDGGPIACQAIALGSYRRSQCGAWETAMRDGELKLLRWPFPRREWSLPIVLAVLPKT